MKRVFSFFFLSVFCSCSFTLCNLLVFATLFIIKWLKPSHWNKRWKMKCLKVLFLCWKIKLINVKIKFVDASQWRIVPEFELCQLTQRHEAGVCLNKTLTHCTRLYNVSKAIRVPKLFRIVSKCYYEFLKINGKLLKKKKQVQES